MNKCSDIYQYLKKNDKKKKGGGTPSPGTKVKDFQEQEDVL